MFQLCGIFGIQTCIYANAAVNLFCQFVNQFANWAKIIAGQRKDTSVACRFRKTLRIELCYTYYGLY